MPELARPEWLWLLLLLPPLVWWWTRRRRVALRYPLADALAALGEGRANRTRWLGLLGRVVALALGVLALAGPRWPDEQTRLQTAGIGLMLLVDVSGSMAERDFTWDGVPTSRLEAVQRAFRLLLAGGTTPDGVAFAGRPTDLAGLLAFASRAETTVPPTLSHSVLLRELDGLKPQSDPRRAWTNLTDAILLGLDRLEPLGDRPKALVLLTDGVQTVDPAPSGWRPRQAAQAAQALGVPIYVLDAGGDVAGLDAEAKARRQEAVYLMQEVARLSGGRYLAANDSAALVEACRTFDRMKPTMRLSFQYLRYHEAYPWVLLAALGVLVVVLALERTRWRSLP